MGDTEYENPAVMKGRAVRFRRDRLEDIDAAAKGPGRDASRLIRFGADLMLGSVRCGRCDEKVPLELGDTSGGDMYDWMAAAERAVLRQKHGAHHPVLVGAEPAEAEAPVPPAAAGRVPFRAAVTR